MPRQREALAPVTPVRLPFEPSYPIETDRLLLRPYEPDDLEFILDLFGREDVCRYLNWEPMDAARGGALLERRVTQSRIAEEGKGIALVAVERATARAVGELVLGVANAASRQGEVGWSIHPDVQGRGLGTEAARAMLRLGFEELGLHRIIAECDPRNAASIRVMERLGLRREAHHLEVMFLKGEWVGSMVYAMLDSEWIAAFNPSALAAGRSERTRRRPRRVAAPLDPGPR